MILKAYSDYKTKIQFPAILLFIILFVSACSSTKYIGETQSVVREVHIDSLPPKLQEEALNYVQKDIRPAPKLGINVGLYNLFYTLFKTKSVGNPAPLLDSTLVEISRNQIEKYLGSKGYFNAKVSSDIKVKKQRAKIYFKASPGPAFFVKKLGYDIDDAKIKEIYFNNKERFTHLREGMQYDDDSLAYEREQIYELMKHHGYFDFARPYVKFTVDSNSNDSRTKVMLIIDNPDGKTAHSPYKIGESNVIIAPNTEGFPDSIRLNPKIFRGIRFTDLSGHFRRNPILRYDFIKQGELYDNKNETLTYDRLYELNVFKNVKIDYIKPADSVNTVNPVIRLTPQKRMSNRVEGELPFNAGTVGFTLSNTYINNNIFRGAERFEFQVKGGLQSRLGNGKSLFTDIYQRDFSVSTKLSVPRLLTPIPVPMMGKNGMPYTSFGISYVYALQKDAFVRKVFQNTITYDWYETKFKVHSFTPLNLEYRLGNLLLVTDGPDTAQNNQNLALIKNNLYNLQLLGRKDITLGMRYSYTLNQAKLLMPGTFMYFKGSLDIAGNLLQGVTRLFGNIHHPSEDGQYSTILGLPFNQYVRPEIDVRWYKNLGGVRQFVARVNAGVGVPYGNSTAMPFEKLFFAGGSNGVRAWQARTLGPGNYNRDVLTQESRTVLYGLDQLGEVRIESNFEYRYKLLNKFFGAQLKGAVFLDAGNVWSLPIITKDLTPQNREILEKSIFKFSKFLSQMAIGTGVGLRYDVDYFVFRFDIGLKIKDPQFSGSDQWVISKYLSGAKDFKEEYNRTHAPDTYRFVQYNFGIGMPF